MDELPWLVEPGLIALDLNKNGRLDPYEDPRLPLEERLEDLLAQMTLEEKAGLMFHTILAANMDGSLAEGMTPFGPMSTSEFVSSKLMNHFNVHMLPEPRLAAEWHNRLQVLALSTRLGIPVTLSSDPRHAFSNNPLTALTTGAFSQWPEPVGLAAIGDAETAERFGDIARQEYLAAGHPGRPAPDGRPGDRAALGAHQRHLWRGRPAFRKADRRLHPRFPGAAAWA